MKIVVLHALALHLIVITLPVVQMKLLCTNAHVSKQYNLCASYFSNFATYSNEVRTIKGKHKLVKLQARKMDDFRFLMDSNSSYSYL